MSYPYGAGYPTPNVGGQYNYYQGGGGYPPQGGGYPGYYGGGSFGPYQSPPTTPFENVNAQLYQHEEQTKGMVAGGISGAAIGAAIGTFAIPIPGVGTAIGGILGGLLGGGGGKFLGGLFASHKDAGDNGKIDGSPLLMHQMEAQHA